jgi:hypothetical protein
LKKQEMFVREYFEMKMEVSDAVLKEILAQGNINILNEYILEVCLFHYL